MLQKSITQKIWFIRFSVVLLKALCSLLKYTGGWGRCVGLELILSWWWGKPITSNLKCRAAKMKSHATVTWITMVPQEGEFTENLPPAHLTTALIFCGTKLAWMNSHSAPNNELSAPSLFFLLIFRLVPFPNRLWNVERSNWNAASSRPVASGSTSGLPATASLWLHLQWGSPKGSTSVWVTKQSAKVAYAPSFI